MSDIEVQKNDKSVLITLYGRLDAECVGQNWSPVFLQLKYPVPQKVVVDASGLDDLDGAGIAFLLSLQRSQEDVHGDFEIIHLKKSFQQLLQGSSLEGLATESAPTSSFRQVAEDLGKAGYSILNDLKTQVSFLGELGFKLVTLLLKPHQFRWRDFWYLMEKAGADAINITSLLGFLIGVILAFQMAVLMAQFAAEAYVADAMVLIMFRES